MNHTLLALLVLLALALAGCGGGDDGDGGGGEIPASKVRQNLEDAGYTVQELTLEGIPSQFSADFASGPDSGYDTAFAVSGKGLKPPVPDFSDTVAVVVYDSNLEAGNAFDSIGGEEVGRKREGNRIYTYGGLGTTSGPPELDQVIEASEGS